MKLIKIKIEIEIEIEIDKMNHISKVMVVTILYHPLLFEGPTQIHLVGLPVQEVAILVLLKERKMITIQMIVIVTRIEIIICQPQILLLLLLVFLFRLLLLLLLHLLLFHLPQLNGKSILQIL